MRRQRGIALVQVLLVAGIISLLMLQMSLTAREHLARARVLSDRAESMLAAQSHESALIYTLLTQPLAQDLASDNPYVARWNFRGEPFEVGGVTISIQDESGLQRVPMYGPRAFVDVLVALGVEPGRARRLGEQLMQVQMGDGQSTGATPAFPLQALEQLRWLPDMDDELYGSLRRLTTLYPTPGFNWLTAPRLLRSMGMTESQLEGFEQLERTGELNPLSIWKVAGIEADEFTVFTPGPALRLTVGVDVNRATAQRTTTMVVRPYVDEAVVVWQRETEPRQNDG